LYYVYLIESLSTEGQRYIGITGDLKQLSARAQRRRILTHCEIQAMEADYVHSVH